MFGACFRLAYCVCDSPDTAEKLDKVSIMTLGWVMAVNWNQEELVIQVFDCVGSAVGFVAHTTDIILQPYCTQGQV